MKYTCQYDSRCGGCDMLAFDYEKQLAKKKQYLSRLLAPYGKVDAVLGMSKPLHYRNKVHAVLHRTAREISQAESMRPEPIM